jgi:hypothetical protein
VYEAFFFWVWLHVRGRLLDGGSQPGPQLEKISCVTLSSKVTENKNTIQDRLSIGQLLFNQHRLWALDDFPDLALR